MLEHIKEEVGKQVSELSYSHEGKESIIRKSVRSFIEDAVHAEIKQYEAEIKEAVHVAVDKFMKEKIVPNFTDDVVQKFFQNFCKSYRDW